MGATPVGKEGSVDDRGVARRCPRGRNNSARTAVRRPGSLRGAATVMVGTAVASGPSAPSPVSAPRSDRVRPLTPAGGAGISSLREQGRALLPSGAEQSQSCLPSGTHSSPCVNCIVRRLLPMTVWTRLWTRLWTIRVMDRRWMQQRWARWVRCWDRCRARPVRGGDR